MLTPKWGVAKVGGVESEEFFIFAINTDDPKGPFMRTSDFFREDELRAELKILGSTESEIEALIEKARATPV